MPSTPRTLFFLPIFLMDVMVLACLHPVSFPGFIVMNTISILTLLIALHIAAKKRTF